MTEQQPSPTGDQIITSIGPYPRYVAVGKNVIQIVFQDRVIELGPEERTALLAEYRVFLRDRFAYLQLAGVPVPVKGDIPVDQVYVKLRALPEKSIPDAGSFTDASARASGAFDTIRRLGERQWQRERQVAEWKSEKEAVDPKEVLTQHCCVVMLGLPGAGKSTLLRYLTRQCAIDTAATLPLFIPLSRLDTFLLQRGSGFLEAALALLTEHMVGEPQLRLQAALAAVIVEKQARFLFDGLDEVLFRRRDILDNLAALAAHGDAVVVTSRPVGYERLNGYEHYEVLPLLPRDAQDFTDRWFGALTEVYKIPMDRQVVWVQERARWLKAQLNERPALTEMAQNPLMLTFLIVLAGDEPNQELPPFRKDLYREYVECLLTAWETRRQAEGMLVLGDLRGEKAKKIALWGLYQTAWLLQQAYFGITSDQLPSRTQIETALSVELTRRWHLRSLDAETLPAEVLSFWIQAGLLDTYRLEGQEWPIFRHQVFQEYGAARALAEAFGNDEERLWSIFKPHLDSSRWAEVIPLTLAHLSDITHIIERLLAFNLINDGQRRYVQRPLILAATALADGARIDDQVRCEIVEQLLNAILSGMSLEPTPVARDAVRVLEWFQGDHYVEQRLRQVSLDTSVDGYTRMRLAEILGKVGQVREASVILASLATDRSIDSYTRTRVAEALGRFGQSNDLKRLAQNEWADAPLRLAAAKALADLGSKTEATPVLRTLAQNEMVRVGERKEAATALGELDLGDAAYEAWLFIATDQAVDARSREEAVEELRKLGRDDEASAILSALKAEEENATSALLALARNWAADAPARQQAVQELGELGRSDALLALAQDGTVPAWIRMDSATMLGALHKSDEAVQAWSALASDRTVSPWDQVLAVRRLGGLEPSPWENILQTMGKSSELKRGNALLELIQDESGNPWARVGAADSLAKLGRGTEVIPVILALVQNASVDTDARRWAIEVLANSAPMASEVAILLGELAVNVEEAESVRKAAQGASDRISRDWLELASDETLSPWEQAQTVRMLGDLKRVGDLLALVQDESMNPWVRVGAANSLGKLDHGTEATASILALIQNDLVDADARRWAVEILADWASETSEVLLVLEKLAADTETPEHVRDRARVTLKQLAG